MTTPTAAADDGGLELVLTKDVIDAKTGRPFLLISDQHDARLHISHDDCTEDDLKELRQIPMLQRTPKMIETGLIATDDATQMQLRKLPHTF